MVVGVVGMLDIIISDLHLGSDMAQVKLLGDFLDKIASDELVCRRLVLNGDVLEHTQSRLKRTHWKILSTLRSLSDKLELVWVKGNHDHDAEAVAHLIGANFVDAYSFESGLNKVVCVHGDTWDDIVNCYPFLVYVADFIYRIAQKIDRSHGLARNLKSSSKYYLRCDAKVWENAVALAASGHYNIVCCGHTHKPQIRKVEKIIYCNTGSWTELPCTYVVIDEGKPKLYEFQEIKP